MKIRALLVQPPPLIDLKLIQRVHPDVRELPPLPLRPLAEAFEALHKAGFDVRLFDAGLDPRWEPVGRTLSAYRPHLTLTQTSFGRYEEDVKVLQLARAGAPFGMTCLWDGHSPQVENLLKEALQRPEVDAVLLNAPIPVLTALIPALQQHLTEGDILPVLDESWFLNIPGLVLSLRT